MTRNVPSTQYKTPEQRGEHKAANEDMDTARQSHVYNRIVQCYLYWPSSPQDCEPARPGQSHRSPGQLDKSFTPSSTLFTPDPLPPQPYSRPTDLALPDDGQEVLGRGEVGHVQHVGEAGDHLHLVEHGPLGGRGHHQQPPALGGHLVDACG